MVKNEMKWFNVRLTQMLFISIKKKVLVLYVTFQRKSQFLKMCVAYPH